MFSKDKLLSRLKELDTQLEQALSTVSAIHGAKQEVNYWLTQLAQEEVAAKMNKIEEEKHDNK